MLNRRTFLQTSVAATTVMLSGCRGSQNTFDVTMLQGSLPPQLVGDFRKSLTKTDRFKLKPETELQKIVESLETWHDKDRKQSFVDSLPLVGQGKNRVSNIVTLGDSWLQKAIADNLIQPLDTSKLEGWDNLSDPWQKLVTRDTGGDWDSQGKVYGAPYRWGNTVIAYRKDKIDWTPTDWSDLWREELQGKISLLDNYREVIGLTLKKLGHSYNSQNLDGIPNLESELQKLHKQVKFYSSDNYLQPLVLGDTWLAVGWSNDILNLTKRYSDIAIAVPASGSSLWADIWVQPHLIEETSNQESDRTIDSLINTWIDFCWQSKPAKQILLFTNAISPIMTQKNTENAVDPIKNPILKSTLESFTKSEFLKPLDNETQAKYVAIWQKIRTNV